MKILLYCIFTNEYVKMIKPWLETTVKNFYPHCTDVLILTDNPDYIEDRRGLIVEKIESLPFRNQELWMKNKRHMEILEKYKDSYDIFANIQANCFCPKLVNEENFPIYKDKLTVFEHTGTGFFEILTTNTCKIGSCGCRSLMSYEGKYTHAGMTIGGYDVMFKMNKDCHEMYLKDKSKGKLSRVPYHDESYINSWRADNKELVNVLPRINSGYLHQLHTHANPFFLVDKDNLGVMKNKYVIPAFIGNTRFGNWLFLIAACYAHCLRNGYEMRLPNDKDLINKILPDEFGVPQLIDTKGKPIYTEQTYHYTPIPSDTVGFVQGFFQSSKHFKPYEKEVKQLFHRLVSDKKKEGVAGIHIRMGDYLKLSERYKSPDKTFIKRALGFLSPHIKRLIIFSDEPEKARKLVESCCIANQFTISCSNDMGETDEIHDIYFMTACEEFIMSCSSFSWWAAYLGEHKKVIVDKKWYNDNQLNEKDLYEDNWIKI